MYIGINHCILQIAFAQICKTIGYNPKVFKEKEKVKSQNVHPFPLSTQNNKENKKNE